MSQLGAYRIVNLTYNNDSQNAVNKIIDELFELTSEHSLMLLRNGGGKSVQVQMLISPFVSPKHRDMNSRKFNDYFTDEKNPTYIVTEWELENNDKVMIGLAVKKAVSLSSDEEDSGLDIKAFVYEYSNVNDEFGIRNIPFSKKTDKGYTVMTMSEAESLFKSLKSKNKFSFNYYDLNIPNHRGRYYEKLRTYSIEPSEWESIIKVINLSEGGLSDLFKNCKTEATLIEEWILKNIGIKLNRDEDVVKEMGKSIKQYVNNKQSKQNLIDIIHGVDEYNMYSGDILKVNSELKVAMDNLDNKKSEIEDIMVFNYHKYSELQQQEQDLQLTINELNKDIAFNKYEESSFEYHNAVEKVEECEDELFKEEEMLNGLKAQTSKLERDLSIQEVISFNNQKVTKEKELDTVKAKIEKELKSNAEIQEQLTNVAYSLNSILKDKKEENLAKIQECEQKENEIDSRNSTLNLNLINLKAEEKVITNNLQKFKEEKQNFDKLESALKSEIELPLGYTRHDVEGIQLDFEGKINKKEDSINSIKDEIDSLNMKITSLKDDKNNKKLEEIKILSSIEKSNAILADYESECEKMKGILEYLGFDDADIFDKEGNLLKLRNIIDSVISKNDSDVNKKNKKMSELDMLKKGIMVEMPKDIRNRFEELEIEYELGLNYLNKLKVSDAQKLELLEKNPFLPFSIILDGRDMSLLKNTDLDIASSYNIYILDRDDINLKLDLNKSNSVYTLSNLNILSNFNKALLSEDVKKEVVESIEQEISSLNTAIAENRSYLNELERCKNEILNFKVTQSMIDSLKVSMEKEVENFNEVKAALKEIDNEIRNIDESIIPDKNILLSEETMSLSGLKEVYNLISKFVLDLSQHEKSLRENIAQEEKLNEVNEQISNTEKEMVFLGQQKKINEASYRKNRDIAEEINYKLGEIENLNLNFDNAVALNDDFDKLDALFKALKSKSSLSLDELEEKQESLLKEVNMFSKEISSLVKLNDIKEEEYVGKPYMIELKEEIKNALALNKEKVEEQEDVVKRVSLSLGEANYEMKSILKSCEKAYKNLAKVLEMNGFVNNYSQPFIEKESIQPKDFKEKSTALKRELFEYEEYLTSTREDMSYIDSSVQKLDFLSDIKTSIVDIAERKSNISISKISEIGGLTVDAIKDYKHLEKEIEKAKGNVDDVLTRFATEFKYKDIAPFSKNIQSLLEVKHDPATVESSVESTIAVLDKLKKQYEADLKIVNEEKNNISKTLLKYVEQTYNHMAVIDRNSRINIEGENKKMLEIHQPEWNVVLYSTKVEEFLENIVQMCEVRIRHNESIDEYIATQVKTNKLYDAVVGIKNVNIVLRKLEALNNRIGTSRVKWANVVKNSGGEGFVSAFVVLVSLLSYMRKDIDSIGDKKEDGKVLIMDNPFGKMSSEHLIKPVMTIAEKYNTQLICFTAQKGENIYNRFPNVYHMETEYIASAKMNVLTATKENEVKETQLSGSRFSIEEQQTMEDYFSIK